VINEQLVRVYTREITQTPNPFLLRWMFVYLSTGIRRFLDYFLHEFLFLSSLTDTPVTKYLSERKMFETEVVEK
jgi:hypothetical protein